MGRDTIQLEIAVSTISQEYLIEFTFDAPNPSKVKTGLRPRAAHEVPLLTATASRVIDIEDPEVSLEDEVAAMGPHLSKKRDRRVNDGVDANAPPKVLRKDYTFVRPKQSTNRGKSLSTMGLAAGSTFVTPADTKGVSDPDLLSYAEPVKEIDLLPIHGWVTRRYLSARMRRDQHLPPGHPGRMPSCCRSHSVVGELYPHMLIAIAGRRWVIGHGLRLAIMKCAESIELRQAYANVVFAGIAKGMSEGLAHGIEYGKAGQGLEDALKWIQDLRPSTSQLKIPVYLEVRDPRNPWAVKEEMLLEEAIAANVSHAEKKKRCRVVCRTHGVGSAHHARSDGVPVSMPTVAPQGLEILLADAATQTATSDDDACLRLLRSKSLPPMYNLDWP
nr:hypothetical protein [Tanacetum cinerariifolium]